MRFTFEGTAYQYSVLPFGMALAPHTFSKCMDAALFPLQSEWVDPHQEGPAISGEWLGVAPEPRVVKPSCMAASGISEELRALHSRVLVMLVEVLAPATRCLYALKWEVFVKWCGDVHIDPATCSVLDVLRFLQYRLDSGYLPSTLKVYVAAIASFRSPLRGQSIGRHALEFS